MTGAAASTPFQTLRHKQFARFIAGATVASIGQFLAGLATPYYMNQLTDSNAWVGAAGFAGLMPAVFATPIAGILADRVSRRGLLVLAYSAQALLSLLLVVLYFGELLTPWRIIFLMLGAGVINGFMFAPIQSMAPILVPESDLVKAVQLVSIAFTVGRAIGPGVGALVLYFSGPGLAWSMAVGCQFLAAAALFFTRPRAQPKVAASTFWSDFREGIRYISIRPGMRLAVRSSFVVGFLGAVWAFALAASVADDAYGVGGGGLGLLATMVGVGSVLASAYISRSGSNTPRSRLEVVALGLYGLGILVAAATPWLVVGLAGYLLVGVAHMWHNVTLATSLQVQVEESHRGRVMSVWLVAVLAGLPLGALIGGILADIVDLRFVMASYGSLIVLYLAAILVTKDRFTALDDSLAGPLNGDQIE